MHFGFGDLVAYRRTAIMIISSPKPRVRLWALMPAVTGQHVRSTSSAIGSSLSLVCEC
jgi:hypothetical protein